MKSTFAIILTLLFFITQNAFASSHTVCQSADKQIQLFVIWPEGRPGYFPSLERLGEVAFVTLKAYGKAHFQTVQFETFGLSTRCVAGVTSKTTLKDPLNPAESIGLSLEDYRYVSPGCSSIYFDKAALTFADKSVPLVLKCKITPKPTL
jgi:hypothetical protein